MQFQITQYFLMQFKKYRIFLYFFIFIYCALLQGCIPILIGAAIINDGKQKEAYTAYTTEVMKDNTQREIHGLTPNSTMSYKEWKTSLNIKDANEQKSDCSALTRSKC